MSKKADKTPDVPPTAPSIESVSLDSLVVDPANVRIHGDKNRQTLDASLRRFGAARSIVVDARGVVRAGNGTLEAARAAGMTDAIVVDAEGDQLIVVRRKDWSPTEATAYAIADNRSSDLAEDDPDALARTLQALMNEGFDLAATGFSEEEANTLIEGLGTGLVGEAVDDPEGEWRGMPECENGDLTPHRSLHVHFAAEDDVRRFGELIGQEIPEKAPYIWFPARGKEPHSRNPYVDEP